MHAMTAQLKRLERPRPYRAIKLLVLILLWLSLQGTALAQLSPEAREALSRGGETAAQALATYDTHYLDRPLWREAISYGERAKELAPDEPEPYQFLGRVYSIVNWYSRAWDAWTRYVELGGQLNAQSRQDFAEVGAWLGNSSFDNANYQDAVFYYERYAELEPDSEDANRQLALSYLELGQPEEAQIYLSRLELQAPGVYSELSELSEEQALYGAAASAAYREGLNQIEAGNLEAGADALEEAVNINDNFLDAFVLAAETNLELGRTSAALNLWRGAANVAPDDARVVRGLAAARARDQYGDAAYDAFQAGVSDLAAGNTASAQRNFQTAVNESDDYAAAYGYLGEIALEQNNLEQAETYYAQATRLEPNDNAYSSTYASVTRQLAAQEEAQAAEEARAAAAEEARLAAEAARAEAQAEAREAAEEEARLAAEEAARLEQEAAEREAERLAAEEEAEQLAEERRAAAAEARAQAQAEEEARAQQQARQEAEEEARLAAEEEAQARLEAEEAEAEAQADAATGELRANIPVGSETGEPITLVDVTYTHQNGSAFSFFKSPPAVQDSLTLPVNYAGGTLYERVEVLDKPSSATVQYQLCLVHNDGLELSPACRSANSLSFDDTGVFETSQRVSSLSNYGSINWNQGLRELLLVIKDEDGNAADNRYGAQSGGDLSSFYPMEVHYTAILVPPAGDFPGWP